MQLRLIFKNPFFHVFMNWKKLSPVRAKKKRPARATFESPKILFTDLLICSKLVSSRQNCEF